MDKLLEEKRKKFFEVVYNACKKRKLPRPKVNFEGCDGEDENQLAHYHPDNNQICVSKRQLSKLSYDDIEETATHEVTHIIEQNHESSFYEQDKITKIGSTRIGGVYMGGGNDKSIKIKDEVEEESEIDKTHCNYCGKKAKLNQCPHCEKYFCETCFNPKLPGRYTKDRDVTNIFIEHTEFEDEKNNHPCPDYYDYLKKKKEEDDRRYREALARTLGSKHNREKYKSEEIEETIHIEEEPEKKVPHYHREYVGKRKYEEEYEEKPKKVIGDQPHNKVPRYHKDYVGKRNYEERDGIKKNEKKELSKPLLLILAFFIIIIIGIFYYHQQIKDKPVVLNEIKIEKEEQSILEEIPINISFAAYMDDIDTYTNKDVTLTGFLSREIEKSGTGGIYVEYIIDDFDNKITLLNLNKEQMSLFPKIGKTGVLYNVKVKFKKKYRNLDLEVSGIVNSERPIVLIEKN